MLSGVRVVVAPETSVIRTVSPLRKLEPLITTAKPFEVTCCACGLTPPIDGPGTGVSVGVCVAVAVGTAVFVGVGTAVLVAVGVGTGVLVKVGMGTDVEVGVGTGVF